MKILAGSIKNPWAYDICQCGAMKHVHSKQCRQCCTPRSPADPAIYEDAFGQYRRVALTKEKYTSVTLQDFDELNKYKWTAAYSRGTWYAVRSIYDQDGEQIILRMHNVIFQPPDGFEADHIDHDGLNNRRFNLRKADRNQQCQSRRTRSTNKCGFKGVDFNKASGRWRARISIGGKTISLGRFKDDANAATAYNIAAVMHFGEFSVLNQ